MKPDKYQIHYVNGNIDIFHCKSIREAIYSAWYWALTQGWNNTEIDYITEGDNKYSNIMLTFEKELN